MRRFRIGSEVLRGVALTLAVLALVLKVAIPQGMMVGPSGSGLPLVVCTGHGPLLLHGDGAPKAPSHKPMEAPCAFAAAGAAATPPLLAMVSQPTAVIVEQFAARSRVDLAPGRGLAAPPPPSHAPPTVSV